MPHSPEPAARPGPRRPTFGERVAAVNRLLGGNVSRQEVCRQFAIGSDELDQWIHEHARDRPVHLDEFRTARGPSPQADRLSAYLRRLEALLDTKQRELCMLRQLARGRGLL
ncbi:MAG: hypothetical protein HY255_00945 [Betaproteobacteria bacterium]|nr:hypothetical protein [Betaproteobacteria bacterium]